MMNVSLTEWPLFCVILFDYLSELGGNQREVDRQRSQKRAEKSGASKKKKASGSAAQALTNKKEHDAEIMRQKQLKAEEKKAGDVGSNTAAKMGNDNK